MKVSKQTALIILRFLYQGTKVKVQQTPTCCAAYLNGEAIPRFTGDTWQDVAMLGLTSIYQPI